MAQVYSKKHKNKCWKGQKCLHHPGSEGVSLCCRNFRCKQCHEGHLRKNHPASWAIYRALLPQE